MGPKKAKASGDPAKGEKLFKNLCALCHSLSVSKHLFYISNDLMLILINDKGSRNRTSTRRYWWLKHCFK